MFLVENITSAKATLPASSTLDITTDVSKDGYTPIGIVGVMNWFSGASTIAKFNLDGTDAIVRVKNHNSTAYSNEYVILSILYMKD